MSSTAHWLLGQITENQGGDRLTISHAQSPHISEPIEANHLETSALPLLSMRLEISGRKKIFPRNRTQQCALGPFLRPNMYLWCYWSNLGMWYHVFVQSCSTGGGRTRSEGWFLQGERSFNVFGAARPRWHEKWLPQRGNHDCRNWANVADRS